MKEASEARFSPLEEGTTVTISLPDFDRSEGDVRNLIGTPHCNKSAYRKFTILTIYCVSFSAGVVMEVHNNFYKIGPKNGTLSQLYSRKPNRSILFNIPNERKSRKRNTDFFYVKANQSLVDSQGFKRCGCTTKCKTNRSHCKK